MSCRWVAWCPHNLPQGPASIAGAFLFAACTVLGGAASNLWLKDGRVKALGLGVFLKIGFSSGYTPTA